MYYTIYKITNKINDKYYIGKHQTNNLNDGYMGSGKILRRSIKKYGIENFTKEILFIFDNELEMNNKEKELVVISEETYNLCSGGQGGFGYINNNGLRGIFNHKESSKIKMKNIMKTRYDNDLNYKNHMITMAKNGRIQVFKNNPNGTWFGKKHTEETKIKIGLKNSIHQRGDKNNQFGTMWITNGFLNKKIKKDVDIIPDGWYKGRVTQNI